MLRFRKALIATGTAAILGLAATLTPAGRAVAQDARTLLVEVVNTPGVKVVNSPRVESMQAGSWNVDVNSPVVVGNDASKPVPIFDIAASGRQPFRARFLCGSLSVNCEDSLTVPAGRLLVIETYSADCETDTVTPAVRSSIAIPEAGGLPSEFYFPLERSVIAPGLLFGGIGRRHSIASAVRLYADPGTEVEFRFLRSPTGSSLFCQAAISGFLTD